MKNLFTAFLRVLGVFFLLFSIVFGNSYYEKGKIATSMQEEALNVDQKYKEFESVEGFDKNLRKNYFLELASNLNKTADQQLKLSIWSAIIGIIIIGLSFIGNKLRNKSQS